MQNLLETLHSWWLKVVGLGAGAYGVVTDTKTLVGVSVIYYGFLLVAHIRKEYFSKETNE